VPRARRPFGEAFVRKVRHPPAVARANAAALRPRVLRASRKSSARRPEWTSSGRTEGGAEDSRLPKAKHESARDRSALSDLVQSGSPTPPRPRAPVPRSGEYLAEGVEPAPNPDGLPLHVPSRYRPSTETPTTASCARRRALPPTRARRQRSPRSLSAHISPPGGRPSRSVRSRPRSFRRTPTQDSRFPSTRMRCAATRTRTIDCERS
jgi:hypothetical protein